MKVHEIEPDVDADALLAGAQFVDAFRITVDDNALDARCAAERMMARGPRWVETLITVRNRVVAPFGLKTPAPTRTSTADTIGIFPVLSETPSRVVDFRVVVDVVAGPSGRRVTATTLVLTHNLLGRLYLRVILPFHRLIARTMLRQVAD